VSLILAIDPGPTESGYCAWNGARVVACGTDVCNEVLRRETLPAVLRMQRELEGRGINLAIEKVACFGAPVGALVFETVFFSGRLSEWWEGTTGRAAIRLTFGDVTLHHCLTRRAKESQVRQALIDRFGAPGTKAAPGLLYRVHGHAWSALGLAVAVFDQYETLTAKAG
jgi:hypothetical protein